jgi:hypothetical protein
VSVRIYQLAREWDYWTWLCPGALARKMAAGWQVREAKDPPEVNGTAIVLTCDERWHYGCCAQSAAAMGGAT